MNPWNILGWLIVVAFVIWMIAWLAPVLIEVVLALKVSVARHVAHLKTRNTPPAKGQRWFQCGPFAGVLEITNVSSNGDISFRSGNASWGDTPEGWRNRVKNRKMFLCR